MFADDEYELVHGVWGLVADVQKFVDAAVMGLEGIHDNCYVGIVLVEDSLLVDEQYLTGNPGYLEEVCLVHSLLELPFS